jgi:FkbM family methyltransferase
MIVDEVKTFARMLTNRHGLRRSLARGYAFDLARLLTDEMLVDCGQARFYVATSDDGVGRELFVHRHFDEASFERTFALLAQRGHWVAERVFLDVGANIGTTSVMAATKLGCSQVFAFEPSHHNARMLRQNILVNGLEGRITPIPAAVSDASGEVEMRLCGSNSGDHRISGPEVAISDGRQVVTVAAVTLDGWLEANGVEVESVGVVWIDAQGHEPWVLGGASRLLASDTPIVCEFWPHGLRESGGLERLCDLLGGCGRQVIDLGPPSQVCDPRVVVGDGELLALADRYPGTNNFCDLLLLR